MEIIDVRDRLVRSAKVPQTSRSRTGFVTLHWNGPGLGDADDLAVLQSDARYHVNVKGWDGLSYHYGVGRHGVYRCRDYNARLAHSGVTQGNNESLSVLVIHGDGDTLESARYDKLLALLTALDIQPRYVLGHQEWPRATACPGALIRRWLAGFRARYSDGHLTQVPVVVDSANVRDEPDVMSLRLGSVKRGDRITGRWMLGRPVKGDCLWLEVSGEHRVVPDGDGVEYVHGSMLDSASYRKREW